MKKCNIKPAAKKRCPHARKFRQGSDVMSSNATLSRRNPKSNAATAPHRLPPPPMEMAFWKAAWIKS